MFYSALPDDLTERDQWIPWRYETTKEGRITKVPVDLKSNPASITDPQNWHPYEVVYDKWQQNPQLFDGIGYVFGPDDPFAGIDLDDCLENGQVRAWAQSYVEQYSDTYMEISPSGTGIKIFVRGKLPGGG